MEKRSHKRKALRLFQKEQPLRHSADSIVVGGNEQSLNESFNRLKDNVIYSNDNGKNKVFQIESSVAGEGKSFVLVNLAVSLAMNEKKVVLVDLDFRRPKVHREFGLVNDSGIADYMRNDKTYDQIVRKTTYGVDVVTSGKGVSNTSLILTSNKFAEFMDRLRSEYDYVLLDCPPVLQVSDYILISKYSDCVIFVVSCGRTKKLQVKEAVSYLRRNDIKILGTVMSFAENMTRNYNGYAYYKYYMQTYYGGYSNDDKK